VIQTCHEKRVPFMILGRGSNLLIRDGGIRGVVFVPGESLFFHHRGPCPDLRWGRGQAQSRRRQGAGKQPRGLEFLEGIPACVGGALRMNAGAMGSETFEVVTQVRFSLCICIS